MYKPQKKKTLRSPRPQLVKIEKRSLDESPGTILDKRKSWSVEIPLEPISVNDTHTGRHHLKDKAIVFKNAVLNYGWLAGGPKWGSGREWTGVRVTIEYHGDWLVKSGKRKGQWKQRDVTNCCKILTDSVFDSLGLDDCIIVEQHIKKIDSRNVMIKYKVEEL